MTQQEIKEKQEYLLDSTEDLVSNLVYYDRKECEMVSRKDIKEILTNDFANKLADKFREELLK